MATTYLCNAFSLGMLPAGFSGRLEVTPVPAYTVADLVFSGLVAHAIGHATTAALVEQLLTDAFSDDASVRVPVPAERITVAMAPGDRVIVAQYVGSRLPEGATVLPEGARIEFVLVEIVDQLLP